MSCFRFVLVSALLFGSAPAIADAVRFDRDLGYCVRISDRARATRVCGPTEDNFSCCVLSQLSAEDKGKFRDHLVANRLMLGMRFAGADLEGLDLSELVFRAADFRGANLRGTYFNRSILLGSNFKKADLRGSYLTRAVCLGANFGGTDLRVRSEADTVYTVDGLYDLARKAPSERALLDEVRGLSRVDVPGFHSIDGGFAGAVLAVVSEILEGASSERNPLWRDAVFDLQTVTWDPWFKDKPASPDIQSK